MTHNEMVNEIMEIMESIYNGKSNKRFSEVYNEMSKIYNDMISGVKNTETTKNTETKKPEPRPKKPETRSKESDVLSMNLISKTDESTIYGVDILAPGVSKEDIEAYIDDKKYLVIHLIKRTEDIEMLNYENTISVIKTMNADISITVVNGIIKVRNEIKNIKPTKITIS